MLSLFKKKLPEDWETNDIGQTDATLSDWLDADHGQLALDVYQTGRNLVVKAAIAGVNPDDLDIDVERDIVTIRGKRRKSQEVKQDDYYYRECHWGAFSRSIVLPVEVNPDMAEADLTNGILTITLPKADKPSGRNIVIRKRNVHGQKNTNKE
ncbi:MAG: Hsp20/alpha crystallin family protein [bacterium]